jgi:zinc and cadmium transporter
VACPVAFPVRLAEQTHLHNNGEFLFPSRQCDMFPAALLTFYCCLVVAASLAGGVLPSLFKLSHTALQVLMSGVGGFMIGVAVLHLLPHGYAELHSMDWAALWMLIGIVAMFFLIRVFHVHQHATMEPEQHEHVHQHAHGLGCADAHHDHHIHDACLKDNRFSWLGLGLGLAIHTLIDGLALGAAVAAAGEQPHWWDTVAASVAIFLAVALHKPLDALSITTTMAAGGWSPKERWLANIGFSLMCPLGAALFYFGAEQGSGWHHVLIGGALAFSAGVFLCVSLADILPELSFHSHDRWSLSAALLLGIAAAIGIGFLEPEHSHAPTEALLQMNNFAAASVALARRTGIAIELL